MDDEEQILRSAVLSTDSSRTEHEVLDFVFASLRITVLALEGVDMMGVSSPYVEFMEGDGEIATCSRTSGGSRSMTTFTLVRKFISKVATLDLILDSSFCASSASMVFL